MNGSNTILEKSVRATVALAGSLAACLLAAGPAMASTPVYRPDPARNPQEDASYPRVIRLSHGGADKGALLAAFFHGGVGDRPADFAIYRSGHGGRTWSPASEVHAVEPTYDLDAPGLFELPAAMGDLPTGALLAAGTAWKHGDFTRQRIEVFASTDHGRSWRHRSDCAREDAMPDKEGFGIWEPTFAVAANGELACYFSDERPSTSGYPQVLAHVASRDGGASWGPETFDVAVRDGVQRPGMASVARLPDGRYAMTFEDCRKGVDPDQTCSVRFKTSADGLDWAPVADLGTPVATADGHRLVHTPYLAWSPAGGPSGTLIVSGQRVATGEDGHLTLQPESGRVLMINTHLGAGPWREIASPVVVDPTGGYDAGETGCAGYSSAILPDVRGPGFLVLAGVHLPNGKCEVLAGRGQLPSGPAG